MQREPMMNTADELEARVTRALEHVPVVEIPADFAARVAGQLPKRRAATIPSLRMPRFGQAVSVVCLLALMVAMLLLVPRVAAHTDHGVLWTALEWTLCGQFVLLATWLGVWRRQME